MSRVILTGTGGAALIGSDSAALVNEDVTVESNVAITAVLKGPTASISATLEGSVSIVGTLLGPTVTVTANSEVDSSISASLVGPTVSITALENTLVTIAAVIRGPTVFAETLAIEKYQYRWNGIYQGVPEVDTITEILVSAFPDINNPENDRTGWFPGDNGNVEVRSVDGLGSFGPWSAPQPYAIPHDATLAAVLKGPTVSLSTQTDATASIIGTLLGPSATVNTFTVNAVTITASLKGPTVSMTNVGDGSVIINAALSGPTFSGTVLGPASASITASLRGPGVGLIVLPQGAGGGGGSSGGIGFQSAHYTDGGWNVTLHEYTVEDFGTSTVEVYFKRRMRHVWIIFDTQPTSGVVTAEFRTAHRDVTWQGVDDNIFDLSVDQDILLVTNVQATAIRLVPSSFVGGTATVRILAETSGGF